MNNRHVAALLPPTGAVGGVGRPGATDLVVCLDDHATPTATSATGQTVPSSTGRRHFILAGSAASGGLAIGFHLRAFADTPPPPPANRLKPPAEAAVGRAARKANPVPVARFSPGAFIRIDRAGHVAFIVHKVEMGQGTFTSMPMLLAEELEVDVSQVKVEQAPADGTLYDDPLLGGQVTGGSTSIRALWLPARQAGAAARMMLVQAAAEQWGVDVAECRAERGAVHHAKSHRQAGYGQLVERAAKLPVPTTVVLKEARDFSVIGKPVKRLDSADKVNGRAQFGIDVRLPGMKVATVAASPVTGGKLASADDAKALAVKGVRQVVRIDGAVAVVADHMWAAKQGLAALAPQWTDGPNAGFSSALLVQQMDAASRKPGVVARHEGDPAKALAAAGAKRIDAVYQLPFLAHATMEPINCTVDLTRDACTLWVGTQVPTFAQGAAAKIAGLPVDKVTVLNQYIGGGFGRRLEVDSVVQAVTFAKQIEGPVKFVWTREEDVQHDMYRPYYYDRLSAVLGDDGKPQAWTHRVTGSSVMSRFAPPAVKNGLDTDAVEGAAELQYAIPNFHCDYVRHEPPVATAFWRGVGPTHNVFVVESFIDELAATAKQDPVAYRHALLAKAPRARGVLELAARKAGWGTPVEPLTGHRVGRGVSLQFAFGSYMAQVADVAVASDGAVKVTKVVCAVDCGQVVNPDTVQAQVQGGIVFGITAALWSEITFDKGRVQQHNFNDYRMLRIDESPTIEVHIVPSSDTPGGMGECGTAAIAPALANAVHAATGKRIRKLPLAGAQLKA